MKLRAIASAYCPPVLRPAFQRLENSPIGLRLARGMFWSFAGALISRSLMLVAGIVVARLLGKTGYGELGIIQSTIGMFGTFAGFGLGLTATKHVAEFRQSDPERAGRVIGISGLFAIVTGGVMSLGLFIFAPLLAEHTLNAPNLAGVLRISALILFVSALNGAQTGALSGFEAFKTIAYVNLFVGLLSFPILIAGAYLGGLTGAIWATAINLCFNWVLNRMAIIREARRHRVPFTFKNCGLEWPILWKFSFPAAMAGTLVGPVNWLCNALLVNQSGGYGEMGVYNAANQWYAILMFLPGMLGGVTLPVLSEQIGRDDTKRSVNTLIFAIKMNALLTLPLVLLLSIASPFIMNLYGQGFYSGWPTLVVVLFTAGLLSLQTPVGQIIAASGRMWLGLLMNAGWAFMFIVSTLLLVHAGSIGLAASRAIAYVFHATWTFGFAIWLIQEVKRK